MSFPYIPDFPSAKPEFEFETVAKGLLPLLQRRDDPAATVLGIHGPWGSGKTTLLEAIRRELDLNQPNAIPIEFNAWKFQDREVLWRALILQVLGELRKVKAEAWLKKNPGKTAEDFPDPQLREVEDKMYRAFAVDEKGPWKVEWRTLIVELLTIGLSVFTLGFVGTAVKGSAGFFSKLFGGGGEGHSNKKKAEDVLDHERIKELAGVFQREVLHRQVNQVQSIEQFLTEFRKLIAQFQGEFRRVFVFVDDLDRCLPESALEIFEAIKLFMDAPGIAFVIALDRDTIRKALAVRYTRRGDADKGQNFLDPDEYIEKTISVSFDLPRLSAEDAEDFVAAVKQEAPIQLDSAQVRRIAAALGPNPRRLRRFMNTLVVNLHIAGKSAGPGGKMVLKPENLDVFIKLLLISYRYSALFSVARDEPDLLIRLQQISNVYDSTDDKKTAREARTAACVPETFLVKAAAAREEFWRLMSLPPLLNHREQVVMDMLNWFRYREPPAKGA